MSNLNQAAVKRHALVCSKQCRNGKFTRIGADFLEECEADVECIVRELRNKYASTVGTIVGTEEQFVTSELMDKLKEELNSAIGRLIRNKIQRQPTVGCTAGRTH